MDFFGTVPIVPKGHDTEKYQNFSTSVQDGSGIGSTGQYRLGINT